jgi:hypothetical protein
MKPLATLTVRRQKEYEKSDCFRGPGGGGGAPYQHRERHRGNKAGSKGRHKNKHQQGGLGAAGNSVSLGSNRFDQQGPGPAAGVDNFGDEQGLHFVETPENSGDALKRGLKAFES